MKNILEYIKSSRDERRYHLDLNTECLMNGGNGSSDYKGLLAYYLGTTIPCRGTGFKIHLCHACGNHFCSNVNHLYWGTPKDNIQDSKDHGTWKSIHESTVNIHGIEKVKDMARLAAISAKEINTKPMEYWESFRKYFVGINLEKRGWITKISKELNMSHTHIRRIAKKLKLI